MGDKVVYLVFEDGTYNEKVIRSDETDAYLSNGWSETFDLEKANVQRFQSSEVPQKRKRRTKEEMISEKEQVLEEKKPEEEEGDATEV